MRLRVVGVLVAALFALMFIRLWYLQVLDTSAYSQTVSPNQVRLVQVPAPRGLIMDRTGSNILVGDQVTRTITLSRVAAQQHPDVVGQLAALLGITPATDRRRPSPTCSTACTSRFPILDRTPPLSDVLYIGEHASMFPGVSSRRRTPAARYPYGADRGADARVRRPDQRSRAQANQAGLPARGPLRPERAGEPVRAGSCGDSPGSTRSR